MAEDQWTESVDTAAKTLTAHSGKMFPASQAVPALTQMSARAKETIVERVDAIRKELDDRKYTAHSLATEERCHLLSRELQACYVEKNRTQPAMKAVAALIESVLKILPTCFSHSPSRSGKPDWLFEERWRADGEALEQLLSAIAAGVLDAFTSFDVPQQDSPADSARETLDQVKEKFGHHALPAFAAVAARDGSQKIDPRVRRDYMKVLCMAIKGNKRCKGQVMEKSLGIPGIETLLANATDGRILQHTFHILWMLFFRENEADRKKMGEKIFTRRSVPSEEARKKLKELWASSNNRNINVLERDEPMFLQVLAGTSLDKAQTIDIPSANYDGKTLDIYSSSKNVMQTRLSLNQRSIDLRVGRHDKLWEVPLAAITRLNLSTIKNDNVQAEIVFTGPPVIDNVSPKHPREGSHSLVIATSSADADLLKRALFQRYTPAMSDKGAPESVKSDGRSLAPPKASQPAAVDILRSSPTPPDADVASSGEKAVQTQTAPKRREQTVMRDSDTSKDEESIAGNSSGSRKTRAITRQAESAQVQILAGDSHPSSVVGTQRQSERQSVTAAVSQKTTRDTKVTAASSTSVKQHQEKEAIEREAATMDLSGDESELSELEEGSVKLVETSRKKVTVQQTVTVEQERAVIAVKPAKESELADRKGKKRGSDALETVPEIEELDEEDVGPSTRSSKKAKLEVLPPPALKAEKPTSKVASKATTSDSGSTKTGKGKVGATYGIKNKSRQRGKKGRDSGVGVETDSRDRSGVDDSDGAGTDYDMPGVDKPAAKKKEAAKSSKAAPSTGKDTKGKSAGGKTEKKEVAISSSTPKKAKAKAADIKVGAAAKADKPSPWREESQFADAPDQPMDASHAKQEIVPRLNAPRTRAPMAPIDSDPIEPNASERGTSGKPVSAEISRSRKPIQSMAQLCASDDAPARWSEPTVAEKSGKAKPALTVTKPEQPAQKPISTGSRKSDKTQQPTSARSAQFPVPVNVEEALLHSETGDQAVDNAFGDLFDAPEVRATSVAASDRTADQIKRYTNLYDDEGEAGGGIAIPAINTIAATQDRVHNSLMDVDNAMQVDEAPVAARTRAKTPDLRAKTPEVRGGTSPAARTDIVSPQLDAPVDTYAVLSTPASVKAKKELAEIEQDLAKPSEPEPIVKQEYVDLDSSSDSDEPMEESEEVEEADDDEDEYLPAPARRAMEKSAEKKVVERDPRAKREWEEAVQLHRKQENAKIAEAKVNERRTRRDPSAGVEAESRRREETPAMAAIPEVPAMSTAQRRRAAVREAQNKKVQESRQAAERAADEAIADIDNRRRSAPLVPLPEISMNAQPRRAAGRKSEPVPQYRPAEESRAPARSRRVAALAAEENAMPPPRRERSPAFAQPQQQQTGAVPMIQPRKLDNSLLGLMKQLNQVILDGMHQKMDDYGTSRDGSIDAITRVIEAGCEEAQRSDLRLIKAHTHANETIHTVHSNFMAPISQIQEEVSDEKARLAADKLVANELANLLKAKVHLGLFSTMSSLDKVRKRRGVKA